MPSGTILSYKLRSLCSAAHYTYHCSPYILCFFLRADPKEKEFLYPPLTFLQPNHISKEGGYTVVEVTPMMT